ncbi:MAG: hypothetical protein ACON4U_13195 [Myxococcota bacterium]
MKIILLSQHPPFTPHGQVSGEQIRAEHLRLALESHGHTVHMYSTDDLPKAPSEQLRFLNSQSADALVSLSIDLSAELEDLTIPHVLDLYAPRVQESVFAGELSTDAIQCLRAINAADVYLVSNPRQRWYWLGLLALASVDTRKDPTLLVPLSIDQSSAEPADKSMYFVAGGCNWPWQDLNQSLAPFLDALQTHQNARLKWLGAWPENLPETVRKHPRLERVGWLPYQEYRRILSKATAAFDWYSPNPERELALAFRHMDYLGSGLPILGYPNTALQDIGPGTGIYSTDVMQTTVEWLQTPRLRNKTRKTTAKIAADFHWSKTSVSLINWLNSPKKRMRTPSQLTSWVAKSAGYHDAVTQAEVNQVRREALQTEVSQKRQEIETLNQQLQTQLGIIDRLSCAVDEVSGFKREAIQVLDTRIQHHAQSAEELARENAILRADIEKKTAELSAMDALRERLENDLHHAQMALEQARKRRIF